MQSVPRQLSARERTILHQIVGAHIESGEPVGSRTLARLSESGLSPATIRNVMADLADDGYLAQPHTSSGRIPTEKAFRDFAANVLRRPLPSAFRQRIMTQMQLADTLEARVDTASRVLTEFTRNVGIATALPASSQELEHIELAGLSDRRVLMIVATRDRMVRNRVVTLDHELTAANLTVLRNYINHEFSGWTLERARTEMLRRIEEERARYDEMMSQLTMLCRKGLFADTDPSFAMDGASYLIGLDLRLTRDRMHELFRALEQKEQVVSLLDRFLDGTDGQVGIHVGLEDAHPAMAELALIGLTVNLPSGVRARIAVLGPMRMQYDRVIPAVQQIGAAFSA